MTRHRGSHAHLPKIVRAKAEAKEVETMQIDALQDLVQVQESAKKKQKRERKEKIITLLKEVNRMAASAERNHHLVQHQIHDENL